MGHELLSWENYIEFFVVDIQMLNFLPFMSGHLFDLMTFGHECYTRDPVVEVGWTLEHS